MNVAVPAADSNHESQHESPAPSAVSGATRRLNSTRSSQLFEAAVELPLTPRERELIEQLDFFKRWYLLCHAAYLMALVLTGSLVLFASEPNLAYIDAFFIAMSTVCNCGLQTVDVGDWNAFSVLFRHVLMIGGGVVFTSAYQPLLRLLMLRRVRSVFESHSGDSAAEARLRRGKALAAAQLYHTSVLCAVTSWAYFAFVNCTTVGVLYVWSRSRLSLLDAVYMSISAFHSCVFLSMVHLAADPVVTGLVTAACALGFTAFPVVLRAFFIAEWRIYTLVRGVRLAYVRGGPAGADADPLLLHVDEAEAVNVDDQADGADALLAHDGWQRGFRDILRSPCPGSFHPFLFLPAETAYLGAAWWALTLMQAVPLCLQQWHGALRDFSPLYRVYLAVCQAGTVRFAAASFVPLAEYSNALIAVTILAMYLPALPISTDRTYRKWRQMMATSVMRLLTSRLFWLFAAMVCILFAEEGRVSEKLHGTRFDVMTRTFFEIISAYSGCGHSLTIPGSRVSFTGSGCVLTKLCVCAVLFGGRHRFVDLGIDLGFTALRNTAPAVERPPTSPQSRLAAETPRTDFAEDASLGR